MIKESCKARSPFSAIILIPPALLEKKVRCATLHHTNLAIKGMRTNLERKRRVGIECKQLEIDFFFTKNIHLNMAERAM